MKLGFLLSLIIASAVSFAQQVPQLIERPPQFVLISFDGSKSHNFWRETMRLSQQSNAQFTYFISGVYFLMKDDRQSYKPPKHNIGASDIGFAENDLQDIQTRTELMWYGMNDNNPKIEIGSHVNGHFDGSLWTDKDWTQEFSEFHRLVEKVFSFYPKIQTPFVSQWPSALHSVIKGFRAPLLAGQVIAGTAPVLKDFGYAYDASQVLRGKWPYKHTPELWNLGLSRIALAGTNRETVAMDYNVLYGQCNGVFNPKDGGECKEINEKLLKYFEDQTYLSYAQAYLKNYYGNRMPLSIGHHFSLWNKGVYWRALQRFVREVCTQPETKCISHMELVNWLNDKNIKNGYGYFNKLNQAEFKKTGIPTQPKDNIKIDLSLLRKVSFGGELFVPEISKYTEKVMLKGDLPHAHDESPNDVDLDKFRYVPVGN